jgi:23S rRNA pseudouridine1911/1915/1917 synthase
MQVLETYNVPPLEKPIRIQEYAIGIFNTVPTRSALKKALKKERISVDGKLVSTAKFISGGERIELYQKEKSSILKQFTLPIKVLFEDDYLAVVYKPAGILVSGNKFKTLANALPQNLKKSTQADAVTPQPAHRLDYPTTGVLVIGKTSRSILALNKLFEYRAAKKTYFAVSIGKMPHLGIINTPIDTKKASTKFEVLKTVASKRFTFLNLVKLSPKTGRRHQLRKHLSEMGNPILGDKEYGEEGLILPGKGLYLHAGTITFEHPITKENISISKETPNNFQKIFPED